MSELSDLISEVRVLKEIVADFKKRVDALPPFQRVPLDDLHEETYKIYAPAGNWIEVVTTPKKKVWRLLNASTQLLTGDYDIGTIGHRKKGSSGTIIHYDVTHLALNHFGFMYPFPYPLSPESKVMAGVVSAGFATAGYFNVYLVYLEEDE